MGEITDDILEGWCCQVCGWQFDDAPGYRRTCEACEEPRPRAATAPKRRAHKAEDAA